MTRHMTRGLATVVAVGIVLVTGGCLPTKTASTAVASDVTPSGEHIIVPSFIVPGSDWDGIAGAYPVVGIALLNVDSGPGTELETSFQAQVDAEQSAGVQMYGYVSSGYGAVPLSDAEAQINDYAQWYGIRDIFVDEASTNCSEVSIYYQPLYEYIHANGGQEILNPGTATSECYMAATDILDSFEGTPSQYATYVPPAWTANYPASSFFNEVYSVPTQVSMRRMVAEAVELRAGWVYVTKLGPPNPYDELPSYWSAEVAIVAASDLEPLSVTTTSLPAAAVGVHYSASLEAIGGHSPSRWRISSGKLPRGLRMSTKGEISGTPTAKAVGTSEFTVMVIDPMTRLLPRVTATQALSITVDGQEALDSLTSTLP